VFKTYNKVDAYSANKRT